MVACLLTLFNRVALKIAIRQFSRLLPTSDSSWGEQNKRKIDPKAVKLKSSENASGNTIRQKYDLLEGIDQEMGKKITKMIKDTKA